MGLWWKQCGYIFINYNFDIVYSQLKVHLLIVCIAFSHIIWTSSRDTKYTVVT